MLKFVSKYRNYLKHDKPIERVNYSDGNAFTEEHYVFFFDNRRGASVIRSPFTIGGPELFELAVLYGNEDGGEIIIDYSTPITNDVVGNLTEDEVTNLLTRIKDLPFVQTI